MVSAARASAAATGVVEGAGPVFRTGSTTMNSRPLPDGVSVPEAIVGEPGRLTAPPDTSAVVLYPITARPGRNPRVRARGIGREGGARTRTPRKTSAA